MNKKTIIGYAAALIVLVALFRGYFCGRLEAERIPPGYALLAETLSQDILTDPRKQDDDKSLPQIMAEIRAATMDLRTVTNAPEEIVSACRDAAHHLSALADHMDRLNALPKPPGVWEVVVENFIRGFVGDIVGGIQRSNEVDAQYKALQSELEATAVTWDRIQTCKLLLPRLAAKYAPPPTKKDKWLQIDFDESFGSIGPDDWITLVNDSGHDLANVTIAVELKGKHSEYRQNVHFVELWEDEQSLYARYSGGTQWTEGRTIERQTVLLVQEVIVSVWSDRLTCDKKHYQYVGTESDQDIKRYCKDLGVWSSYRPFKEGWLGDTQRGVKLTLKGMGYVIAPRVTIDFIRGDQTESWYWDFKSWSENETITCDTGGKLAWKPEKYTVHVTFPNATTSYEWTGTWEVK